MALTTSLADLSVLLVEPSSMQAHLVQRMLENQGVRKVIHVGSAHAALTALQAAHDLTVVISSLYLPDLAGTDLVAAMRAEPALDTVPFLARQVSRAARKVGPKGAFHLTDVTPIQIEHGTRKLASMPWTKVIRTDAASFDGVKSIDYDLICSFFLLHEVPDDKKYEIVNNMLDKLPKGSKAVFVDYHNPSRWQPIRYILKLVNHYLEPFAEAMWHNEVSAYAKHAERFTWRKKTFFGGVYQCVVVEHIS